MESFNDDAGGAVLSNRYRNPPADRMQPNRHASQFFQPDRSWEGSGHKHDKTTASAGASADGFTGYVEETVALGVRLGYEVVDEYLKQAERLAHEFSPSRYGFGASEQPRGHAEYGPGVAGVGVEAARQLAEGWLQMMLGMTRQFWPNGESLASFLGNAAGGHPQSERPASPDFHTGWQTVQPTRAGRHEPRIPTYVDSSRVTQLKVELSPEANLDAIVAQPLLSRDSAAVVLTQIEIRHDSAGIGLHITIPDDAPAGFYNGVLLNSTTSQPAGTVALVVEPGAGG